MIFVGMAFVSLRLWDKDQTLEMPSCTMRLDFGQNATTLTVDDRPVQQLLMYSERYVRVKYLMVDKLASFNTRR